VNRDFAFDQKVSQRVERLYQTPDIVEQRRASRALLQLAPGEHVLDIGCGPGLLVQEMAREVGAQGSVAGIDVSGDMLALAQARCASIPNASVREASATSLPFADASFDAVASTQVYEFVDDIALALSELKRVLKPGGRALIVDTDWDSVVWNNSNYARMARVIDAWHAHCPHPHLPSQLPRLLREAGLQLQRADTIALVNARYETDTYSYSMIQTISKYAADKHGVSADEAAAWADDLTALGTRGDYFFCVNRFAFLVGKPTTAN
jgi:arsenite methyltransferase